MFRDLSKKNEGPMPQLDPNTIIRDVTPELTGKQIRYLGEDVYVVKESKTKANISLMVPRMALLFVTEAGVLYDTVLIGATLPEQLSNYKVEKEHGTLTEYKADYQAHIAAMCGGNPPMTFVADLPDTGANWSILAQYGVRFG